MSHDQMQHIAPKLVLARQDVEQRLGISGLPFTRVRSLLTDVLALVLTIVTYLLLIVSGKNFLRDMVLERGNTPYVMGYSFRTLTAENSTVFQFSQGGRPLAQ